MNIEKEMTAPVSPVGAGAEQSQSLDNSIISDMEADCNSLDELFAEQQRKLLLSMDLSYLPTVTMNELYEQVYTHKPPLIEGLLYTGTYLFVGAPKLGKSFFMAQLACHISTGKIRTRHSPRKTRSCGKRTVCFAPCVRAMNICGRKCRICSGSMIGCWSL